MKVEAGVPVAVLIGHVVITDQTLHRCEKKYQG